MSKSRKNFVVTEENAGTFMDWVAPYLVEYLDNPYVKAIHGERIFYNNDFYVAMYKLIHDEKKTYVEAYSALGFDVQVLGENRANQAGKNTMEKAAKNALFTLDPANYDGKVPLEKMPELTPEEQLVYYRKRVIYLEIMNDLQKKIVLPLMANG